MSTSIYQYISIHINIYTYTYTNTTHPMALRIMAVCCLVFVNTIGAMFLSRKIVDTAAAVSIDTQERALEGYIHIN